VLHVIIGKDGTVLIADPVSGPNELVDAAVATVKQWRYKPTLSDGQPVEVETQVSINYTLH
jgi:outer membrane biosynthesis protein TonB